jgi:CYTH domain-containing protein
LRSERENIEFPTWLGREVSGDRSFYNASLSVLPYAEWEGAGEASGHIGATGHRS